MKKPNDGRWKKGQSGNPRGRPKGATRLAVLTRRGTYPALEEILEMIKSPDTDDRVKRRAIQEWLERSLGKVQPGSASALEPDGGSAKDDEPTVIIVPSDSYESGATPLPELQSSAPQLDHKRKAPEEIGVYDTKNSKPENFMKKPNNGRWKKVTVATQGAGPRVPHALPC